jgi:hypothetical protein
MQQPNAARACTSPQHASTSGNNVAQNNGHGTATAIVAENHGHHDQQVSNSWSKTWTI